MKTLIKLVLAALVIHAIARAGMVAWDYFQLKDAAQQTVVFGAGSTTDEIAGQIIGRAAELDIALPPENVQVTRDGPRTVASASYMERVKLLPMYEYPVTLSFSVDGVAVRPATLKDLTN